LVNLGNQILAIALQQVSYQIRQQQILTNLNFEIPAGSQTVVVGKMGAGKSTLLRLLNRLIEPTAGTIYYQGQAISQIPIAALRRQIMLLPQQTSLLGMSGGEAITYPLRLRGFAQGAIADRLAKWTELLQIEAKLLKSSEVQLSAGQKQWLAIARALISEPEVLLLDEPTTHLDLGKAELLLGVLNQLSAPASDRLVSEAEDISIARSDLDELQQSFPAKAQTQTQQSTSNSITPAKPTTIIMVTQQLDLITNFPAWADYVLPLELGRSSQLQPREKVNWQDLKHFLQASNHASNSSNSLNYSNQVNQPDQVINRQSVQEQGNSGQAIATSELINAGRDSSQDADIEDDWD
jgi:D-methionine transport system ATP-binding protein